MREIKRQLVHMGFGTGFILLALSIGAQNTLILTSLLFILGLVTSTMIRYGFEVPLFSMAIGHVGRHNERKFPGRGALLFFLGAMILMFLSVYVFKRPEMAAAALVPVVFGDGVATIVGSHTGRHKLLPNKSLEGSLAGFAAAFLVLLLPAFALFPFVWKAFALAGTAMLVELLPLNDNLSIPVASALVLYIIL